MDDLLRRYLTTKEARALKDALDDFTDSRYILSAFEAAAEDGEVVPGMDLSLSEQDELLSRYIGRAATSSDHHSSLAVDTAEILQRVVDKALNQWPYTETKHVGLLSNLSNPRVEKVGSLDTLVLPSFLEIRSTFRSLHVIPFVSDAADRTGLQLPVLTDVYVMDALLANHDEGRLQIADRIIQLARARQIQLRKKDNVTATTEVVTGEGDQQFQEEKVEEKNQGEGSDDVDAMIPYESITALRNYFEDRTMLNLYPLAFLKSADDIREQVEADRALEKVSAVMIAAPGDATPISSSFTGVLKDLSFPSCVQNKQAMKLAYASLQNLNSASSPQKKMDVIADTCDLLSGMLRTRININPIQNSGNDADDNDDSATLTSVKTHVDVVGADDLLPALMWLILYSSRLQSSWDSNNSNNKLRQAPPPLNLLAHCSFIERYRDPTQFSGRASYCLTHLRSCLQFLITLGFVHGDVLTAGSTTSLPSPPPPMVMDIENFDEFCKKCGKGEHSKLARLCVRCGFPLDSSASSSSSSTTSTSHNSINTDFNALPLLSRGVVV
jgi:hypothetical protein